MSREEISRRTCDYCKTIKDFNTSAYGESPFRNWLQVCQNSPGHITGVLNRYDFCSESCLISYFQKQQSTDVEKEGIK